MSWYVVDVEADGPCPGLYSMVQFGAVRLDDPPSVTFLGRVAPVSDRWSRDAIRHCGLGADPDAARAAHVGFPAPMLVIPKFVDWVRQTNRWGRPVFVSDNLAFDWMWISYYCWHYGAGNPFGYSGRRIGDLYAGLHRNAADATSWKRLRRTRHTHNPVDDALGNAEALLVLREMGLAGLPV